MYLITQRLLAYEEGAFVELRSHLVVSCEYREALSHSIMSRKCGMFSRTQLEPAGHQRIR
jgi:hypothetical protein